MRSGSATRADVGTISLGAGVCLLAVVLGAISLVLPLGLVAIPCLAPAAVAVLWNRPAATSVVVVAALGLLGPYSVEVGDQPAGAVLLAVGISGLGFGLRPRVRWSRFRPELLAGAVLAALMVLSAAWNGTLVELRPYVTRVLVAPLVIGLVFAAAFRSSSGGRVIPFSVWCTALAATVLVLADQDVSGRSGVGGSYGTTSTFLILGVVAAGHLWHTNLPRLVIGTTPLLVGLVLTGTRSSLVAAAIALVAVLLLAGRRRLAKGTSGAAPRIAAVVVLGTAVLLSPLGAATWARFVDPDEGTARSAENRQRLATMLVDLTGRHPLLGVGPGAFDDRYAELRADVDGRRLLDTGGVQSIEAHTFVLGALAELGIPAFLVLAFLLARLLFAERSPPDLWARCALLGVLVAGVAQGIELHPSFTLALAILIGYRLTPVAALQRGSPERR